MSPFTSNLLLSTRNNWDTKEVLLWFFSNCTILQFWMLPYPSTPWYFCSFFCLSSLSVPHSVLISTCVWHALTIARMHTHTHTPHTHTYTRTCAELMPLSEGFVRSGSSPLCRLSRGMSVALSPWRFSIFCPVIRGCVSVPELAFLSFTHIHMQPCIPLRPLSLSVYWV